MVADRNVAARALFLAFILCGFGLLSVQAADWPAIPADELSLKDSPTHPGSHAIILYHEVQTDDVTSAVLYHTRIKILAEQGKKYANIELRYLKQYFTIRDVRARTVRPDGTSVEFEGEIFEKTLVKGRYVKLLGRNVKFLAKTFSLPDVQVGSIIEYKYREQWDPQYLPGRRWVVQQELPIRRAIFTRKRYKEMDVRWITFRVPKEKLPQEDWTGMIRMELENIPPFQEEDYMPPVEELKMRVDFYYSRHMKPREEFWRDLRKQLRKKAEGFIGNHGEITREADSLLSPGDSPEGKLRKLYARAQQIRNLDYEQSKTEKEEKREKLKQNDNVRDVLKNGYGDGWEVNCFLVALARAAGFEASVAHMAGRHEYFFNPQYLDEDQLNESVAIVRVGGQEVFLNPATKFAPYGLLSWSETGVRGLKLSKEDGDFVQSPLPDSSSGLTERKANLKLLDDGTLEGELHVLYHGQAALSRRLSDYEEDETGRRKAREDEIKGWLPTGATVEIRQIAGFDEPEQPLRVDCTVRLPGYAMSTGRRILLPFSIFHAGRANPLRNPTRVHPVYFHYPFQDVDEVTITLPEGFEVEGLPAPGGLDSPAIKFRSASKTPSPSTLLLERRFAMEGIYYPPEVYGALRQFYAGVKTADEEQIILRATETVQQ